MSSKNHIIKEKIYMHLLNEYSENNIILRDLMKPTIAIKNNTNVKLSKFGGLPYFTKSFNGLNFENKSLSFICQIVVDEINPFNEYDNLLNEGVLYFFMDVNSSYPIKKEDYKLLYLNNKDNNNNIEAITVPNILTNGIVLTEVFIEFYSHYNFPSYQNYKILEIEEKNIELDDQIEEIQDYINHITNHYSNNVGSQIFGNPQAIQGTVSFHWAADSLNLNYPFSDKEIKKIKKIEKEFILLLQIDFSDIKITEHFGDGVLYFGIREDDLIKRNFNNVELVYQST